MADFDLSMVATFDASSVASGSKQVEDGIERMSAAEFRGLNTTKEAAKAQRDASNAEKQRERSLADVMRLIDPNYQAQQRLNKSLADAAKLYRDGALSAQNYARIQQMAAKATAGGAQSAAQARASYSNLGFQIQDITQTLALGISPFVVFGQQAGQTASALSGMGGVVGRVATFLSGPFGAAILGAVTVVGLFSTTLFENAEAAKAAEAGSSGLADAQSALAGIFDLTSGKIKEQNQLLILNARLQAINLRAEALAASASAKSVFDSSDKQSAVSRVQGSAQLGGIFGFPGFLAGAFTGSGQGRAAAGRVGGLASDLRTGRITAEQALQKSEGLDFSGSKVSKQEFQQAIIDLIQGPAKKAIADEIDKSLNTGVLSSELRRDEKGKTKKGGREKVDRSAEQLAKFGEKAEEQIQRINEAFDETPKLVDKANQATRQLDDIIADLEKRKPPNFKEMIASAEAAKTVVAESLNRPFQDLLENSEKRLNVEKLIGAGREDEARALEIIYQLQERVGEVTREQRDTILDTVRQERELNEVLAQRKEITDAYLSATQSVKQELESLLSGRGGNVLKALKQSFQDIQGKLLTEKLFGPALRELDKFVKEENGLDTAVDIFAGETKRAGDASGDFAKAVVDATKVIRSASAGTGGYTPIDALGGGGEGGPSSPASEAGLEALSGDIVAIGSKLEKSSLGITPDDYFKRLTAGLTDPLLGGLDDLLGVKFFSGLQGVISGALYGLATGGTPGGVLGGLKGLNDKFGADVFGKELAGQIGSKLGDALGGAQTGTQIAGLAKGIGIKKFSTTGSQIGGAIGSVLPIPGGEIIGSIIGGTIGGLFKKSPFGTAVVGGAGGPTVTGNKSAAREAAEGLGGSVNDAIRNIAEQLDADIGNFLVSIGTYNGKARVSTTGRSGKLKGKFSDVKDFGKGGEEEALAFAIQTAIGQGAIAGISDAMQKALKSSPDIDKAVKEALSVRDLEDLISGLSDLDRAFRDFDKTAAERVRLARAYGLDLVAVEKINGEERAKLLEQAIDAQVGSLKDLLKDLEFGSLFEGTASERRSKILAEIADAEEDIKANVEGAIDRYADLQRQLVETSREAFGTAGAEFGTDRAAAISNAERIIALENERIAAAAAKQQAQIDAATTNNLLTNETNNLLAQGNSYLANFGAQLANLSLSGNIATGIGFRTPVVPF